MATILPVSPVKAPPLEKQTISAKLADHLRDVGRLSSADVAAATRTAQAEAHPQPAAGQATQETTVVEPAKASQLDAVVKNAEQHETPATAAAHMAAQDTAQMPTPGDILTVLAKRRELKITPDEKQAFIHALVHNTRMRLPFSLCGGGVRGIIRSRTVPESRAIIARQRFELDKGIIVSRLDYSVRMRSMCMAAQIEEFQGQTYEPLKGPLLPSVKPDGSVVEPGWLEWIDYWAKQHEAVHTMLWNQIYTFEEKYWRMIDDAADQDFWHPAAST